MMQKKYLDVAYIIAIIVMIVVAVMISACNDSDSERIPKEECRISFATPVVMGVTRNVTDAEEGGTDAEGNALPYSENESFRVSGVSYNDQDQTIPWVENHEYGDATNGYCEVAVYDAQIKGWDTATKHYWKGARKFAFRAYSPADISSDCESVAYAESKNPYVTGGLRINGYSTPDMGSQYDLMYAPAVYDKVNTPMSTENGNAFYNGVNLKFNHALASVHFYVCIHPEYIKNIPENMRDEEAAKFKITAITINGVYGKADFDEKCSEQLTAGSWRYVSGIPDGNNSTGYDLWDGHTKISSYEFAATPVTGIPHDVSKTVNQTAQDIKTLNEDNHIAFMIPQNIPADAEIIIKWTYDTGINGVADSKTKSIKIKSLTKTWKMGYRYIYTIALERDRIKVVPSVDAFGNGEINIE